MKRSKRTLFIPPFIRDGRELLQFALVKIILHEKAFINELRIQYQIMTRLVMKFGGTSVADLEKIESAAEKAVREARAGAEVAVVVSAMAGVTNQLVDYCKSLSSVHDSREYDTVVSSGEQVTAGLMAIAIQKHDIMARSWMGWQLPIECDGFHSQARISHINSDLLLDRMKHGEIAVIAGFQGVTDKRRLATLGRGGSDTSAVALAAALKADRCDIYTDVDGVYTADPRIVPKAQKRKELAYEEMLELASQGAKVLQTRSVEMAMKEFVPLQVLSSFSQSIGSQFPGTTIKAEENILEKEVVNGITYSKDDAKIVLRNVPDIPGLAAKVFGPLADAGINVDMIVQNVAADTQKTDMTFTVPREAKEKSVSILKDQEELKDLTIVGESNVTKISVVGIGMRSHAGVAQKMFQTLAEKGINIQVISTSEIKISVLIGEEYTELAMRALHSAYGLDAKD